MAESNEHPTNVFDLWRRKEAAALEPMPSWQSRVRKSMSPPPSSPGRRPVTACPTITNRPTDKDADNVKPVERRATYTTSTAAVSELDHAHSPTPRPRSRTPSCLRGKRPLRPPPPIQFTQGGHKFSSGERELPVVSPTVRNELLSTSLVRRGSRGRSNTWACRRALHMACTGRSSSQDSGFNTRRNTNREVSVNKIKNN